jgi:hypothetical protein
MVQLHDLSGNVGFQCLQTGQYVAIKASASEAILTSYAYGRGGNVYCGADISPNSNGCCSEARVVYAEKREASKSDQAEVPRIFGVLDGLSDVDSSKVLDGDGVSIGYSALKLPQFHAILRNCSVYIPSQLFHKGRAIAYSTSLSCGSDEALAEVSLGTLFGRRFNGMTGRSCQRSGSPNDRAERSQPQNRH